MPESESEQRSSRSMPMSLALAALDALRAAGPDVTMDQIAERADASRRTLFRHYNSRDELLAEAIRTGVAEFERALPKLEGDWRPWLEAACRYQHESNEVFAEVLGGLLERHDLTEPLRSVAVEITGRRTRRNAQTMSALWEVAVGGRAPESFIQIALVHLSPHFTIAVRNELGLRSSDAARLAQSSILGALAP